MDSGADELGGQQMPNCKTMSVDQRSRRDGEFIKCEYDSRGTIDDYGSRKPIKLNIHSSNKSRRLTGTHPSRKFPQLSRSTQGENKALKDALIPESRLQGGVNQRSATTTESSSHPTP